MRELVSRCTVVEIYVRDTELHSITRQRKLSAPSCSSQELADVGMELFRRHYHWERPIRSIGLRGAGLVEAQNCVQLSIHKIHDGYVEIITYPRPDEVFPRLRSELGFSE